MKSRLPVHWRFTSCDRKVSVAVCVNNTANPKMKSSNSYAFVHKARLFSSNVKNHMFCTKTDCYV